MKYHANHANRFKRKSWNFNKILPNIITLSALCIGASSIRYALAGRFEIAVTLILIASFFDVLDGRVAKMLNATSHFGAQLDSLSDAINFIVMPTLINYTWMMTGIAKYVGHDSLHYSRTIWCALLVFISCGALRLARFNTIDSSEQDNYKRSKNKFFLGIPSTFAGILILLPMILSFNIDFALSKTILIAHSAYIILIALLMISKVKTPSTKGIILDSSNIAFYFCAFVFIISVLIIYPWIVIPLISFAYLAFLPIYQKILRRDETLKKETLKKDDLQ